MFLRAFEKDENLNPKPHLQMTPKNEELQRGFFLGIKLRSSLERNINSLDVT